MPEPKPQTTGSSRWRLAAMFAVGLALTLATAAGHAVAAVLGTLAQPVVALAVRAWRDGEDSLPANWKRDGLALAGLWSVGVAAFAAMIASIRSNPHWRLLAFSNCSIHGGAIGISPSPPITPVLDLLSAPEPNLDHSRS